MKQFTFSSPHISVYTSENPYRDLICLQDVRPFTEAYKLVAGRVKEMVITKMKAVLVTLLHDTPWEEMADTKYSVFKIRNNMLNTLKKVA